MCEELVHRYHGSWSRLVTFWTYILLTSSRGLATNNLVRESIFFAKPVMLQACCQLLGIEADLPSLKDKNRELDQHVDLQKIRNSVTWDMLKLKEIIETKANDCQTNSAP